MQRRVLDLGHCGVLDERDEVDNDLMLVRSREVAAEGGEALGG
ncbi:MAG: hypothetical protein ACLP36_10510 [Acidimicrobiales bacterium]|jgi:delta-aminolevulinic acid dehydratase/porphobilinogen synthase